MTRCSLCEVLLSRPRLVGGAGRGLPAGGGLTTRQLGRSDPGGLVLWGGNKVVMEVVSGETGRVEMMTGGSSQVAETKRYKLRCRVGELQ